MNFCSNCGARLARRVPPDDNRPRFICDQCKTVHYQNPNMVVGCIPVYESKVLLCRRAIEPGVGLWTIPAGYLEIGESVTEGAGRETREETGAGVEVQGLFTVFTLMRFGQVYLIFRARLLDHNYGPTKESLEVRLFSEDEIPWGQVAFSSVKKSLRHYFNDRNSGTFPVHVGIIE